MRDRVVPKEGWTKVVIKVGSKTYWYWLEEAELLAKFNKR